METPSQTPLKLLLSVTLVCFTSTLIKASINILEFLGMKDESPGPYCGRQIKATNKGSDDGVGGSGRSVTVTVKDTCPSCDENHLDFSVGAWNALTDNAAFGTINIEWHVLHPVDKQEYS